VLGKTAARHTSEQFVTFLEDIVASHGALRCKILADPREHGHACPAALMMGA